MPIAYNDRLCAVCAVLEDEYHFVLECHLFQELREQYVPEYYWKRPSMKKFKELMTCSYVKVVKNLSMFVHYAFNAKSL